jgi:DMSO/TMAO reductase YedYZ molybdopterin-dependent catalytic subunit
MGIAQLIAGLTTPQASPVVDVGQAVIGSTPLPVKDWATSTFGTNDKTVLVGGVLVLLFAFAAVIGVVAMRRLAYGMAGLALFGAIGLAAVLTRPDATPSWIWPTLIGACAGAVALSRLAKTAMRAAEEAAPPAPLPPIVFGDGATSSPATRRATGSQDTETAQDTDGPRDTETAQDTGGPRDTDDLGAPGEPETASSASSPSAPTPESAWVAAGSGSVRYDGFDVPDLPRDSLTRGNGRRAFLVTAGVSLVAAVAGEYGGRQFATRKNVSAARALIRFPRAAQPAAPLPTGINPKVAGLSQFITPNGQFYRVDTALIVPEVDPNNWTLRIHGMVQRPVTVTFDQLLRRPLIEDYITLCCVSNPVGGPYIGNAKWLGASLASLLRDARPLAGADQLLCTSADGFTSGTPLSVVMDGREALVAVAMNGTALPVEHGFPARLVVPGLYGYVSACKWVTDIEVTTFAKAAAYWVQEGWAQQGPIKTESRIDVPSNGATVGPGPVTVAGVAWAQHKGIAAVEVQVDNGPWQEATLADVPGIDTWRQWTWQWASPAPGNHTIQARATDKTGYTQTSQIADVAPNGASGYPSASVAVRKS